MIINKTTNFIKVALAYNVVEAVLSYYRKSTGVDLDDIAGRINCAALEREELNTVERMYRIATDNSLPRVIITPILRCYKSLSSADAEEALKLAVGMILGQDILNQLS
jgi:hypothetical protein